MVFLGYVKTCHLWVEAHPELVYEADQRARGYLGPLLEEEPRLAEFFRDYRELIACERQGRDDSAAINRLHELGTRLVEVSDLQELLEEILDATMELQNADFGNIQLYDRETGTLKIVAQRGFKQDFLDYFDSVHEGQAACGLALQQRHRVIIEDVEVDPGFTPHRQIAASAGFRAVQFTPLFSRDGEPIGVLSTHFRRPHRPSEYDLRLTDLYFRLAAESIESRRTEETLRKSEERFRAFVTASSDVVYRMSADWTEMRHLQGKDFVPDTEDPSRAWLDKYIYPDDQPRVLAVINEAIGAKSVFELEHRVIRLDGTLGYTTNTYSTRKVAIGTVRKSIETNSRKWLSRNVRQVCDGGFLFFGISRETVLSEISIPSLSNSPWMREAPHSGLACVICLIRALIWELAEGWPPIFRCDSLVQKSRKSLRRQPMTVSGLTMSKGARHSDQIRVNQTQNRRSFVLITGRFWVRFRMASCCRKARFSRAKLHRPLSVALKKQNSKDSNSLIPIECRARL
jgi:PAS domain-containing protein